MSGLEGVIGTDEELPDGGETGFACGASGKTAGDGPASNSDGAGGMLGKDDGGTVGAGAAGVAGGGINSLSANGRTSSTADGDVAAGIAAGGESGDPDAEGIRSGRTSPVGGSGGVEAGASPATGRISRESDVIPEPEFIRLR